MQNQSFFEIMSDWFDSFFSWSELESLEFTLFNQTITLQKYLVIAATLIFGFLVLVFLTKAIIWLFKFVGGLFRW